MNKLKIEPSPHIRSGNSTQGIMLCVIIALLPSLGMSIYIFGLRALLLTVTCCLSCVVFEALANIVTKRRQTISDLSAIVTGMLLAFNLPVTLPIYMAVIGCFVAIIIVKQLFGGIGQNFANPAIVGRIVLMLSFTPYMTNWVEPFFYNSASMSGVDAVTSATPLALIAEGGAEKLPSLLDMLLGFRGGCLGETSILALLIGAIFLCCAKIIKPAAPLAFILTVAAGTFLTGANTEMVLYSVMSGGLVLGACFMATDYATTPITTKGKIVFGIGCGIITVVIRVFASLPEGVSYSILLMNILSPYIDKLTAPKTFGFKKEARKA